MVLPLPVPANPAEDAVRFISLEQYHNFFDDLKIGFESRTFLCLAAGARSAPPSELVVHDVGAFEASFVPTLNDFDRLDERFRIPTDAWNKLPAYHDFGFAVFKLKGGSNRQKVHPMAFEFPRRNPDVLFFPTIHIHDGKVRFLAKFDHMLYCQIDPNVLDYVGGWSHSDDNASAFMDLSRTEGLVDGKAPCWRRRLKDRLRNKDTSVGVHGRVARFL